MCTLARNDTTFRLWVRGWCVDTVSEDMYPWADSLLSAAGLGGGAAVVLSGGVAALCLVRDLRHGGLPAGGGIVRPVQEGVGVGAIVRNAKCKMQNGCVGRADGSDPTAAGGGVKGGERVAAIGERGSRTDGNESAEHRNRNPGVFRLRKCR